MRKLIIASVISVFFAAVSCKKETSNNIEGRTTTEAEVLTDFANVLVNPNYEDIELKAHNLNNAVLTLNASTNDANLATARNAWREVRSAWEKSEAFLFGPVEDFNYDPTMDTWPVNKVDMDSLLTNSSNPLSLSDIETLTESLKGFHPIEYMLFGVGGSKVAADFSAREKLYMVSLTQSLYNTTIALRASWDVNQSSNFTNELIKAGNGSTRFTTRKDAFIAIVTAMAGICDEVAGGKMEEPLAAQDSTLEESQFSHNSTADFKNNITGIQNAYLCQYMNDGHGLNELVAATNLSLDNTLKAQISIAINSFNAISSNYGAAIYTQQIQIHNAQDAINALKTTLEGDLMNFIQTNIKD